MTLPEQIHGKARIERVGHATPPVDTGADTGVVANDRQRQGVRHATSVTQVRGAPVADRVETPGLQAVQGVAGPAGLVKAWGRAGLRLGRRVARLAVGALQVGTVEVVPAPHIETAPCIGAIAATVVTAAVILLFGQRERMGVPLATPALVLFDTVTRKTVPIGFGVMSADEIMERIFMLTNTKPGEDF